ncbi:hypothetical protein V2I01_12870 [Micromonospora sp. BRA006-A]|nr:hypothetical protein [Micromonospora sp. BRA006-A]
MPTFVGGDQETYSLTMTRPCRERVNVRTPRPGRVAPSTKCCSRTNGSHRYRTGAVVWETANASSGGPGR